CKVPATAVAAEAFAFDPEWTVITARMVQGDRHIRVLSESVPGKDFQAVEPDMSDVYFTALLEGVDKKKTEDMRQKAN
ncbi:MAG: hypothetical protein F6K30_15225, partial [Cyanothece sp. SIO2G6]|nr:hypothetical protein [Cyanothece sp. SIO2G6]